MFWCIHWLQILGNNLFLTLEWQFPVTFYIGFSVGLTSYITNISTSIKYSNTLILDNLGMLFHVVVGITILLLLYNNEISDQICIDCSAGKGRKLPVAAAKACCNALSAITECGILPCNLQNKFNSDFYWHECNYY